VEAGGGSYGRLWSGLHLSIAAMASGPVSTGAQGSALGAADRRSAAEGEHGHVRRPIVAPVRPLADGAEGQQERLWQGLPGTPAVP